MSNMHVMWCRCGFQCPIMCNPAEFFVDTMSKNVIFNEKRPYEKSWFPSVRVQQIDDEKKRELNGGPLPNDEIMLLVRKYGFMFEWLK